MKDNGRRASPGWFPRRGEIYLIRLDKNRPALVISSDALNHHTLDVSVVPMTTVERPKFSMRVHVKAVEGGMPRDSWAKCDQVTTLEKARFLYPPLGRLREEQLKPIEQGIKKALQLALVFSPPSARRECHCNPPRTGDIHSRPKR